MGHILKFSNYRKRDRNLKDKKTGFSLFFAQKTKPNLINCGFSK